MRVIQTPARLFTAGGVERYVQSLSRELSLRGHQVTVLCADNPIQRDLGKGVTIRHLRSVGRIANTNITPRLPLLLIEEEFDIIHAHLPTPWSADWSAAASIFKNKPLVLTYHSDIVGRGIANYIAKAYNSTALKILLGKADKILMTRKHYPSEHLRAYSDKVIEVPIGVDAESFRPIETANIADIFFLSVLDEFHTFKGLDNLLLALKIVKKEFADVKLVVGGSGSRLDYYLRLADSLNLKNNVKFIGFVPEEALSHYYNGCKLFVLPSTDPALETFGIVVLEAMACGRPVIATDVAGAADDIKGYGTGIIVDHNNAQDLANAIIFLLKNPEEAECMGILGRKLVENKYVWHKIAGQIEQIYQELTLQP
ncbi:MAG: glycosyltransferase family 4 protein [Methanotrichaceae archaeon]|nr:glycosyltransferase family 4 protein [Methanotrichaceae archaeon]